MSEVTSYSHGAPSWLELATSDVEAAGRFYGGLFDWTPEAGPEGDDVTFRLRDLPVAGAHRSADLGIEWTTFLAVTSLDTTLREVVATGGEVVSGARPITTAGRMAVVRDPSGAVVGLWEAVEQIGSRLINEAGTPAWHELASRDPRVAGDFYHRVFDWVAQPVGEGSAEYTMWQVGDVPVCGMLAMDETWGALPSHWMPYFATVDTDATVARAVELGGHAEGSPADSPHGRFATIRDPQGALFSVIRSTA